MLRQPIVVVLGHIDHGKTSLLDKIRKTSVQKREAGGITQHIGATEVPIGTIKEICGTFLQKLNMKFTIPGLLFVDTPGHAAFTNLRKRGGSIADIGVLVVDVNDGLMPQTKEAIEILKAFKTPFIVAANKIDRISGWVDCPDCSITESLKQQSSSVLTELDNKIYTLVGQLYELGFESERYDRVSDFTKQVIIVPTSAVTGEGIPEVLAYITGLSQKFMESQLKYNIEGPGRGNILEVKEEKGLGTTIDVILYDGNIKKGDEIAFISKTGVRRTHVRALLKPKPLDEMRDPREKYKSVDVVYAATGVKINAPELDGAIPGSELIVLRGNDDSELQKEYKSLIFEQDEKGIVLKADTLGSLEAIKEMLHEKGIPVKRMDVGNVTKHDLAVAASMKELEPLLGVILAFNVQIPQEIRNEAKGKVDIIEDKIIYGLMDQLDEWQQKEMEKERRKRLESLILPGKIEVLQDHIFRLSKPLICGVRVLGGKIKPNYPLMNKHGEKVGTIKSIRTKDQSLSEAKKDDEVAIAIDGAVANKNVSEGDILYTMVPREHINQLRESKNLLTKDEIDTIVEILKIIK